MGEGFVRFVRAALNVVMQNNVGRRGCKPSLPPGLTLKKCNVLPTQCIHVLVWISVQTAIILFYCINLLGFITQMGTVFCAV